MTEDQAMSDLMEHVKVLVDYWDKHPEGGSQRERMCGLVFSLFAAFDGCSIGLPPFQVTPMKVSPEGECEPTDIDLGGGLHEAWSAYR